MKDTKIILQEMRSSIFELEQSITNASISEVKTSSRRKFSLGKKSTRNMILELIFFSIILTFLSTLILGEWIDDDLLALGCGAVISFGAMVVYIIYLSPFRDDPVYNVNYGND